MGNTPRNWENNRWNMRKRIEKRGKHCMELSLGRFLSHLVISFTQFTHNSPDWLANDCRISLTRKSVHSSSFFPWFSPTHSILYKIYPNDSWWRVKINYSCFIISWRISHPHLDIRNVIKCLTIWFYLINSKTTYQYLTWIVLSKENSNLAIDS